jgi:hypothetical protein
MIPGQLDLLNQPIRWPDESKPGKSHSDGKLTERKAARDGVGRWGKQRASILVAIVEAGPEGLTQWDVVGKLGILRSSVAGRVNELENGGFVAWAGTTRISPMGGPESVYVATERGVKWVELHRP